MKCLIKSTKSVCVCVCVCVCSGKAKCDHGKQKYSFFLQLTN